MFGIGLGRRLAAREKRLLVLLLVAASIAAWKFVPRPWHPSATITTANHVIYSTATPEQTKEMAIAAEQLYVAYSNRFFMLPNFGAPTGGLKMKLYRDRTEFRRINPGLGWAEAFYKTPYCQAYYSAQEINPMHWMLHEATHQLNAEVSRVTLEKWLEEGISEYFSTSRILKGELRLGSIDPNTYPVWWLDDIATSASLATNLANGSVIPLRAILTGNGGPSFNRNVNLYYLHWWSLTHFVFERPGGRDAATRLFEVGGGVDAFEKLIGPTEAIQVEWHAYVRRIKAAVAGHDPQFLRTGRLPP